MESILIKNQKKTEKKVLADGSIIVCTIRYDDQCGNGHNSFSITGDFYDNEKQFNRNNPYMCGCLHDEIKKHFPKLKHLIKWHLMSSNEPLHYIDNSLYFAENQDLKAFRESAIWEDATKETIFQDKEILKIQLDERLPKLVDDFKKLVESIGFVY